VKSHQRLSNFVVYTVTLINRFIQTIFKPIIKLSTVLSSGKDTVPARKRRGVVYEIPRGNCVHKYIGEMKRSLSTRLKEHNRDALPRNILKKQKKTALTEHAAQSGYGFNWDCAHVYIM